MYSRQYNDPMSNYDGYKPADNAKRKSNNTGDQLDMDVNRNVKSYSSKPGQQVNDMSNHYDRLNKMQPVRKPSPEAMAELEARYVKSPITDYTKPVLVEDVIQTQPDVKSQIEHLESLGFTAEQIIAILKLAA